VVILILAAVSVYFIVHGWYMQTHAKLSCMAMFEPRYEHNSYLQINVLGPHATEEYFDGELLLYYPWHQSPKNSVHIVQGALGSYGRTIIDSQLVPFSKGLATPAPLKLSLPTPGASQRRFPFDSAFLNIQLSIQPPIRPTAVIVRNLSSGFIPECGSFATKWDGADQLQISVSFIRNPFVKVTVILIALASVIFASLLGLIQETEDLAVATASYFFSIWSVRSIVVPPSLGYSSLLDLWLMATCLLVLFILAWRLSSKLS
jgi:hypothetical protein